MTVPERHIVVLDTNLLHGDPTLRSGSFYQLLRVCRVGQLAVFLPEIVILELVEWYKSTAQERYEAALDALKQLNRYLYFNANAVPETISDIGVSIENYEGWIRKGG